MKKLILVAALAFGGLLFAADSAQAQYPAYPNIYPTHYYGLPIAPYLRTSTVGYNAYGGLYGEFYTTVRNPFTGYYVTYIRGVSQPFGFYTGYARGVGSASGAFTYYYTPSYYSPGFFRPTYTGSAYYNMPTYLGSMCGIRGVGRVSNPSHFHLDGLETRPTLGGPLFNSWPRVLQACSARAAAAGRFPHAKAPPGDPAGTASRPACPRHTTAGGPPAAR
jgi:hypothetical protein